LYFLLKKSGALGTMKYPKNKYILENEFKIAFLCYSSFEFNRNRVATLFNLAIFSKLR
jgi:hypothetical protein